MGEGVANGANYTHSGCLDSTEFRARSQCVYPTLA